jgi:hypothetical protein
MSKLHELLAAEKTPTGAWNTLLEGTLKKFKDPTHYFDGHSKSLKMIDETPANAALEQAAREEKPVTTTVFDTLDYALDIFGKAEDLQAQKNCTNAVAFGTIMWHGKALLPPMPIDELLGLEARLAKLRELFVAAPTLDASKHWQPADGRHVWELKFAEETTKTEKKSIPNIVVPATKEHPAQVQISQRDDVVGKYTTTRRSGSATALQKAEALKRIDELLIEVKQARVRANDAEVVKVSVAGVLLPLLLEPFAQSREDHQ